MFYGILIVTAFDLKERYLDLTLSFKLYVSDQCPYYGTTHAVDAVLGNIRDQNTHGNHRAKRNNL